MNKGGIEVFNNRYTIGIYYQLRQVKENAAAEERHRKIAEEIERCRLAYSPWKSGHEPEIKPGPYDPPGWWPTKADWERWEKDGFPHQKDELK